MPLQSVLFLQTIISINTTMEPIKFKGCNTAWAEERDGHNTLHAMNVGDAEGSTLFCWKLSLKERLQLLMFGKLWHRVLTFNKPLQLTSLSVEKPAEVLAQTHTQKGHG
jgi:hypothetical protein